MVNYMDYLVLFNCFAIELYNLRCLWSNLLASYELIFRMWYKMMTICNLRYIKLCEFWTLNFRFFFFIWLYFAICCNKHLKFTWNDHISGQRVWFQWWRLGLLKWLQVRIFVYAKNTWWERFTSLYGFQYLV